MGCGHGALGAAIAHLVPNGGIWLADASHTALSMAGGTLNLNGAANARLYREISFAEDYDDFFNIVLVELPKGRRLAQRWLVQAYSVLKPGGSLYLAGPKQQGIQPVLNDAEELFGNYALLGYKKGNRVARFVKQTEKHSAPSWSLEPGIAKSTWYELTVEISKDELKLYSLPGVFSYNNLDEGTRLLLDTYAPSPGEKVLDLGCGYGIIGLQAARAGAAVDLVDDNLLAVAAAKANLARYRIQNGRVLASDCANAVLDQRYTLVMTNPPFHTGKMVEYGVASTFISQAYQVLHPGGRLVLVANKFIRYDRLMREVFQNVEVLAQTNKFHVLSSIKE
jgi:16S rRNA (guanine1207-N2)-methyltransferase